MKTIEELRREGYANPELIRQFGQLHQGDHFISPEGSWCVKNTTSKAVATDPRISGR